MDPSVGLAFSAGLLAIVNPCAIAMIPAYLALRATSAAGPPLGIAILSGTGGLVVGFVGVFATVALAVAVFGHALLRVVPAVAVAIGALLLVLGVATLAGRRVHVPLPAVAVRGGTASFGMQAVFGATYALASLGCALPVFLAFTAIALADRDPVALLTHVAAFASGAAAMVALFVAMGAAGAELASRVPTRTVSRIGGGLLLTAAGAYLLYLQLGFLIGYPFGVPSVRFTL